MLKELFEAITPENIKSIPLIRDAMEIFIENLEERSKISTNIREMYNRDNTIIYENLIKTYLVNLYDTLYDIKNNPEYVELLTKTFPNTIVNKDFGDVIDNEYFLNAKLLKQKKGTLIGLKYAYNLGRSLENDSNVDNVFDFEDGKPFHYTLDGTILKETYKNVVVPLAHPIGFTYDYRQIIQQSITDYLGTNITYKIVNLEVRCISGNIDIFTEYSNDSLIKPLVLSYTNIATGNLYTEEEYYSLINIYYNKSISEYNVIDSSDGQIIEIIFSDDTVLKQNVNPKHIYYTNLSDELNSTGTYIREYLLNCSIYKDVIKDYKFNYSDDMVLVGEDFTIDEIDGKHYFNTTDVNYVFSTNGKYLTVDETL